MSLSDLFGVVVFIGIVFAVLGKWHRTIQTLENSELQREIHEAESEGATQALTQHPQIDSNHCVGCGSCVLACPEHGVLAVVEGRARLVRASHCVGHGCCETACPVGALTVGLGDVSKRNDIPVLAEDGETSVPGVYIAGELAGIGLIRHAIAQGVSSVEAIARKVKDAESKPEGLDLLIVGCGPAGIAAALRAHELGLHFKVIDQSGIGGSVRKYPRNKMTLTQPVNLPVFGKMKRTQYLKEELIELWETVLGQAEIMVEGGVKFQSLETVAPGEFRAVTSTGDIHCRTCLLALGRRGTPRKLNVSGEESERVLYQLIDAADYTNQNLLVVGGGDSAIEAALALAMQPGNQVTLSYRRSAFFRIKARNRDQLEEMTGNGKVTLLFNSQVERIEEGRCSIQTEEGVQLVRADFVFVMAGGEPPYPLLKKVGIQFGGESEAVAEAIV